MASLSRALSTLSFIRVIRQKSGLAVRLGEYPFGVLRGTESYPGESVEKGASFVVNIRKRKDYALA
jgi:hypothetical protein